MRGPADQFHQIERIESARAADAGAEEPIHRSLVIPFADQALDDFQTVDVSRPNRAGRRWPRTA